MKISIIDEDQMIRETVAERISIFCDARGIQAELVLFESPAFFLKSAEKEHCDVVFISVLFSSGGMSGIEAARILREKDKNAYIIFLDETSEHMQDAFSVHAFSYIIKKDLDSELESVLEDLRQVAHIPQIVRFRSSKGDIILHTDEILFAQMEGHYLKINLTDGTNRMIRMTFSAFSQRMEKQGGFLSVNKGILVNLDYVRSFEKNTLVMADGTRLPVRVKSSSAIERQWNAWTYQKKKRELR